MTKLWEVQSSTAVLPSPLEVGPIPNSRFMTSTVSPLVVSPHLLLASQNAAIEVKGIGLLVMKTLKTSRHLK